MPRQLKLIFPTKVNKTENGDVKVDEDKKGGTGVVKIPPPYPLRHMLLREKKAI